MNLQFNGIVKYCTDGHQVDRYGLSVTDLDHDPKSGRQETWTINLHMLETTDADGLGCTTDQLDEWVNDITQKEK